MKYKSLSNSTLKISFHFVLKFAPQGLLDTLIGGESIRLTYPVSWGFDRLLVRSYSLDGSSLQPFSSLCSVLNPRLSLQRYVNLRPAPTISGV
jgi:hypothetical protein